MMVMLNTSSEYGESLAVTQEPEDKELRALLEARRDVLKEVVAIIRARAEGGAGSISEISNANKSYTDADLEAARTPQERIAIFERELNVQSKIEEVVKIQREFGGGIREELFIATAARMKAEIELYKEKKGI